MIEIARALSYQPKVLLLDETTAFLDARGVDLLFRVVLRLKERGIAVGFISHHLDEIDRLANRFTILKDGNFVGSYAVGELNRRQIESKMVGRELGVSIFPRRRERMAGEPLLSFSRGQCRPETSRRKFFRQTRRDRGDWRIERQRRRTSLGSGHR